MQPKQAIAGLIAGLIILLGAAGVYIYSQNKPSQNQPNSTVTTTEKNAQESMENSLSSLLQSGKTQQCSFSYTDSDGNKSEGIAYITKDKMRTDVTITEDVKESNIYVIRNGNDNYIWGSEFPAGTGLKMTLDIDDFETSEDSKKYFDPTKKVDYDCSSWTADSSVFSPPQNIKFSNLSEMIQSMMNESTKPTGTKTSPAASNCSICNSLTGDAKTVCLSELGC